jgi:transposase
MMGMQTAPAQLFYDFCLDDHVPDDHLLRRIDRFLDLEKVRTAEAALQQHRPPLD